MPTAFVTGASRGIGRAAAVHLARAGYDVAVTARTLNEGDRIERSALIGRSDSTPWPGSLTGTAQLIEAEGVRALVVPADLTDRVSTVAAAKTVLSEWGGVDVLVNNAKYSSPGGENLFLDTPIDAFDAMLQANVLSPLALAQEVLPGMVERGSGVLVTVTSKAGLRDPVVANTNNGAWKLGYGMTKGALHRAAGIWNAELGSKGIRAYNVQPGPVLMDRAEGHQERREFVAPPDVVGAVIAWIATSPNEAVEPYLAPDGSGIHSQYACRELGLLSDWPPHGYKMEALTLRNFPEKVS
jgi:NAD(P)-dependent dehydrogenase (short-subunit alcohol dehydrogenase family)